MNIKNYLINSLRKLFIDQTYTAPSSDSLVGVVVVVTGSGKGVGLAIAEVLARSGAIVHGLTRSTDPKSKIIKGVTQIICNLSDEKSTNSVIDEILNKYGHIDLLVNNAGVFANGLLVNSSPKQFDDIINNNIKSTYLATRAVLKSMKDKKSGTIINIGSKISHNTKVEPGKVLYAMSKYAVEGFSYALNRELQGTGVRVICLMPATIHTFFSKQANKYLSPYDIGEIVKMIMIMKNIDFENLLIKSTNQNI